MRSQPAWNWPTLDLLRPAIVLSRSPALIRRAIERFARREAFYNAWLEPFQIV